MTEKTIIDCFRNEKGIAIYSETIVMKLEALFLEQLALAEKRGEEKARREIKYEIYKLDWIQILSQAIKGRPTSFSTDPISEWRNASDQILGSLIQTMEDKGIIPNILGSLKQPQDSLDGDMSENGV